MPDTPRVQVHITGTLRGAPLDADGSVRIVDDVVAMHVDDREYTTRIDRIDGVTWENATLTLYVGRDVVELTGHAGVQSFGSQLVTMALALPEFTRTMQGLGSRRGHPGPDHDRFFASLLAARRAAEGFAEPDSRLAAFEPRRLTQGMTGLLADLAAERYPNSAPDRRALEAELMEYSERLYAAFDALGEAASQLRSCATPVRLARWRDWTWAVVRVFEEADRCWIAIRPVLEAAPAVAPRSRFWRRANR